MNRKAIVDYINTLPLDVKAEYLIHALLRDGIGKEELMVAADGDFKRNWSTDIDSAELEPFEDGEELLTVHLNRSGIYDRLPEALFHERPVKAGSTGEMMAKDSMRLKSEERQVRQLFRPFENELFFYKVRVAAKEDVLLQNICSAFIEGLKDNFWRVDERVPERFRRKIAKLLPSAHQFMGNYQLIGSALAEIIDEDVRIVYSRAGSNEDDILKIKKEIDKKIYLGRNFILKGAVTEVAGNLTIEVGPLKNSKIDDYFHDRDLDRTISCFIGYFIPFELDVKIKVVIDKERESFSLTGSEERQLSFLGYNTVLK